MKKFYTLALAMAACICLYAQPSPVAQKYAGLITVQDARKHLSIIASDEFEGRETGKPGAAKAAGYISNEFKRLGLKPPVNGSYYFDVPLVNRTYTIKSFTVNGTAFAYYKDFFAVLMTGSAGEHTMALNEVVFVAHKPGGNLAAELGNTDIKGKAVFIIADGETPQNWATRVRFLETKNPLLIISTNMAVGASHGMPSLTRMYINDDAAQPLKAPVLSVSNEVANQLFANSGETYETFKASGDAEGMQANEVIKTDISLTVNAVVNDVKAADVLGFLPGTDLKDEVLVFSAHYDHLGLTTSGTDKVYNGADDDGSGTTAILELARAFVQAKKEGHGPRRSILFLGNVGEEEGLLGSEYYTDHPVFPLSKTIADLNIDMIGRVGFEHIGKPDSLNYVYVIGSGMLSTDLHNINEHANSTYTKLVLDYKYDDPNDPNRFYYRSDHYNFAKHGVPIIFYFDGVHADYHQPGDEVSKINFGILVKRTQLVFYTGWDLANRDKRPAVDVSSK